MNIILDYQIFYLQRYGGISRYFSKTKKKNKRLQLSKTEPNELTPNQEQADATHPDGRRTNQSRGEIL